MPRSPDSEKLDDLLDALRTGEDNVQQLADRIGTEVTVADFEEGIAWTEDTEEHATALSIPGGLEGCGEHDTGS